MQTGQVLPPVIPTRPRARELNDPRKMRFLDAIAECGNIKRSAFAVGISRDTHYEWLRTDPAYAEEYATARDEANDELEAEAWRRARWGTSRPVYQMGMLVGYTQEYSDPLLIQLLKAHLPEKYRDRVEQSGTVRHESERDLTKLTDEELAQYRALLVKTQRAAPE
jgi:hypothetical protein